MSQTYIDTPTTPSEKQALASLDSGSKNPYDHPAFEGDEFFEVAPPPAMDWAHYAARGVLSGMSADRMVDYALADNDIDARVELVASLADIIRVAQKTWNSLTA